MKAKTLFLTRLFYCLLCIFLYTSIVSAQDEWHDPLSFNGDEMLAFQPDLRLHLGVEGSIELSLAIPDTLSKVQAEYGIILHGSLKSERQFSVAVSNDRRRLIFSNGVKKMVWVCDFTDGRLHHITFVTQQGRTRMFWDGRLKRALRVIQEVRELGWRDIGYNLIKAKEHSLYIGSFPGQRGLHGWIERVRLWNKAMNLDQILMIKDEATVDSSLPFFKNLIAYSFFTNLSMGFYYNENKIYSSNIGGISGPSTYFIPFRDSTDYNLSGVIWTQNNDGNMLAPQFEMTRMAPNFDSYLFPMWPSRPIIDNDNENEEIEENLALGDNLTEALGAPIFRLSWPARVTISRIAGSHDGNSIKHLQFFNNTRQDLIISSGQTGIEPFSVQIPEYSKYKGLLFQMDEKGIYGVSIAYSFYIPEDSHTMTNRIETVGRWIGSNTQDPERLNINLNSERHGNYSTNSVYVLKQSLVDSIFHLYIDDGSTYLRGAQFKRSGKVRFSGEVLGNSQHNPTNSMGVVQATDQGTMIFANRSVLLEGIHSSGLPDRLIRPEPYDEAGRDKIQWGGTFSLEQRPTLTMANFKGYNIYKMNPRDYQGNTGTSKLVFRYPEENSTDYFTTDNKLIIPKGLIFKSDNVGFENSHAETYSNRQEHTRAWSMNVGINAGMPGIFSFSEEFKYGKEMESMSDNQQSITTVKTIEGRYALVLDKARMQVSDEFLSRAEELRDHLLAEGFEPDYEGFIENFGTHYPYAVTYGGMAFTELKSESHEHALRTKVHASIEAKASASVFGISFGASGGYSSSASDGSTTGFSKEDIMFSTIGGSLSKGQSWSMSKGEEAPLYLDLRPMYELFSPIYFDDPVIWSEIRRGIKATLWQQILDVEDRKIANGEKIPPFSLLKYLGEGRYFGDRRQIIGIGDYGHILRISEKLSENRVRESYEIPDTLLGGAIREQRLTSVVPRGFDENSFFIYGLGAQNQVFELKLNIDAAGVSTNSAWSVIGQENMTEGIGRLAPVNLAATTLNPGVIDIFGVTDDYKRVVHIERNVSGEIKVELVGETNPQYQSDIKSLSAVATVEGNIHVLAYRPDDNVIQVISNSGGADWGSSQTGGHFINPPDPSLTGGRIIPETILLASNEIGQNANVKAFVLGQNGTLFSLSPFAMQTRAQPLGWKDIGRPVPRETELTPPFVDYDAPYLCIIKKDLNLLSSTYIPDNWKNEPVIYGLARDRTLVRLSPPPPVMGTMILRN